MCTRIPPVHEDNPTDAASDPQVHAQQLQDLALRLVGRGHDLSNMLMLVYGNLHLLRMQKNVSGAELDDVIQAADDGLALLNDLLGRSAIIRAATQTDVATALHDVARLVRPLLRAHPITLIVEAEPGLTAQIDPLTVRQVTTNLVLNAIQALTDRRRGGTITLHAYMEHPGVIQIEVSDTRSEWPATLNDASPLLTARVGRLGVGLAASRLFLEAFEGTLTLHHHPEGATVMLELPAANVQARAY